MMHPVVECVSLTEMAWQALYRKSALTQYSRGFVILVPAMEVG